MKHLVDIDFNKNQALNMVLQVLTGHPSSPRQGQMYYNSVDKTVYSYTSNGWINLGYDHPEVANGAISASATGATVIGTITTNTEGHVTAITTRAMTLADLGFTGDADANKYTHPAYTSSDYARSGALKIISAIDIENGHIQSVTETDLSGDAIGTLVINDGSTTSTKRTWSAKQLADKFSDLDNTIAGALVYKGGYDASTNTPNLDSPSSGSIDQGFTYTVTVAGTFLGNNMEPGDMLIAEKDDPAASADWTIVNKNVDEILYATESTAGKIEIATQAEVDAGSDNTRAVTPGRLHTLLAAQESDKVYKAHVGNGSATSFDIIHGLGTMDVMVQVYDDLGSSDTYGEEVGTIKKRVSNSTVRIQVNNALDSNELRVLIRAI